PVACELPPADSQSRADVLDAGFRAPTRFGEPPAGASRGFLPHREDHRVLPRVAGDGHVGGRGGRSEAALLLPGARPRGARIVPALQPRAALRGAWRVRTPGAHRVLLDGRGHYLGVG